MSSPPWSIWTGDMREVLASLPAASVDAVVCDPPYGLGFMDKAWDHGVPGVEFWQAALRVAKPGAHLLAFGGTRTFHRLAVAIEDAGWELRDSIALPHESGDYGDVPWLGAWAYGSGFPKNRDVSKDIDRRKDWASLQRLQGTIRTARLEKKLSQSACARAIGMIAPGESLGGGGYMWFETGMRVPTKDEYLKLKAVLGLDDSADAAFEAADREVTGYKMGRDLKRERPLSVAAQGLTTSPKKAFALTAASSDLAKKWEGWGTALKPAWEPIVMARKPLIGNMPQNVTAHNVGPINLKESEIGETGGHNGAGRYPTNLIHDGSEEVRSAFPSVDGESAARFFYTAKADAANRGEGNNHPTVKPLELMRYLIRMVTPVGGTVLDPFCGSGSTLVAAEQLQRGHKLIGVELDPDHAQTARRRLGNVSPLFSMFERAE